MFDTIPEISPDSVSFYLKKEIIVSQPDSIQIGFSSFEHIPTDATKLFFDVDSTALMVSQQHLYQGISGIQMPFSQTVQSILFLIFAFCFLVFAFWSKTEGVTVTGYFKNVFSRSARSRVTFKEQITTTEIWSEVFLVFQTILILTVLVFYFSWDKGLSEFSEKNMLFSFLFIFLGVLLAVVGKYLIYILLDNIFPDWGMREWIGRYFRIIALSGMLIFIPVMFYVFIPEYERATLFSLFIIFFIIISTVFWSLLIIFAKNKIGLLNYLLYLCAIEIAPFFLLYKGVFSVVNFAGN